MRLEPVERDEIDQIDAATRRTLAETGVHFGSAHALELFQAAGAAVDMSTGRVRIPDGLLDRALSTCSDHFRLWNRSGDKPLDLRDGQVRGHNVGGCVRIYDAELGRPRDATRGDLEELTTLIDGLEHIHVCRPVVYPMEFPSQLRDIYTAATMLRYTDKPYGVSAYSPANLVYILELASVVAGGLEQLQAKPFLWGSVCPDSPLSYSQSTADNVIRYAELGLPLAIAPCPVAGGVSPITLAGTLVVQNGEFLTGLVLAQIVHPGLDVKLTTRPIPMDLRTGTATFGAIEAGMMSAVVVQLARRYRVCSDVYGLGTSAKALDEQAGFEKACNGLLVALAGADLIAAAGMLEDALTSSAEQLVLDNDFLGSVFRAVRGIACTPETLAVELIGRIGPGGNYLTEGHTRKHMRREHHASKLLYRGGLSQWESGGYHDVVEAARDQVRTLRASHQSPRLAPEVDAEIEQILLRAATGRGNERLENNAS